MADHVKPRGKIVRRLGVNIFGNPKYDRILQRKPNPPGKAAHSYSRGRKRISEYGKQLLEKQKIRYSYGLSERQFRNTFFKAKRKSGIAGENFIRLLESRVDNIVYRLGWAVSRAQARQMVNHGHIKVNGKSANIPSMMLKPGDLVTVRENTKLRKMVREQIRHAAGNKVSWLKYDDDTQAGTFLDLPSMASIEPAGDLQAVVEYYSR